MTNRALLVLLLVVVVAASPVLRLHDDVGVARTIVQLMAGLEARVWRERLLYTPPFDVRPGTQALLITAFFRHLTLRGRADDSCLAFAAAARDTVAHMRAFRYPYADPQLTVPPPYLTDCAPLGERDVRLLRIASRCVVVPPD